ncbi:Ferredoxin [metagenome]|uniref:Ferredoxin n=1 Tax=metagenome TaxID=256318 RepID=A0A2P2C467_9ZZZZ
MDQTAMDSAPSTTSWHPIASSDDVVARHVFQARLHGRELAVWRADDGFVNVWENRCLHRGVRLSIGTNDGRELKCQYHGWRYANRTAECTYIPAHPADAPARTIANRTFPVVEQHGLIWTTLLADSPCDVPDRLGGAEGGLVLRAVPVPASAPTVAELLVSYGGELGLPLAAMTHLCLRFPGDSRRPAMNLLLQPSDRTACILRGVVEGWVDDSERLGLWREFSWLLSEARERITAQTRHLPRPASAPDFEKVAEHLAELPPRAESGRSAPLRVRVDEKWAAATDVAGFSLGPVGGPLPAAQPGAHIDVHLPNGQVRQYSVVNAVGDGDRYVIGVKREPASRGGSICLHDVVQVGDVLAISEPRNNFPLRRDAPFTILVAGGIGITPLLAMAQTLQRQGLDHELHYFAQSEEHQAFPDRLASLGTSLRSHHALDPAQTREQLTEILSDYRPGHQVYLCGPGPMLEAAQQVSRECGWPVGKVHFEFFKNSKEIDKGSSFQVALARSCLTVGVSAGQTILEAVREAGVPIPSSCEQGACGTCVATVIEGQPVHQDVYLNDAEKAGGETIVTCVSRCSSPVLVLDL